MTLEREHRRTSARPLTDPVEHQALLFARRTHGPSGFV